MSTLGSVAMTGLLARLATDSAAAQSRLDRLTRQSSSGRVADTYGGLGTAAEVSIDLRPQMASIGIWQNNIALASDRLDTTQQVLGQLQEIASGFAADAIGVQMQSADGARVVAVQARLALNQVSELLNTQQDGQYAFAGIASQAPPLDDAALAACTNAIGATSGALNASTDIATLTNDIVSTATGSAFTYPTPPLAGAPAASLPETGPRQSALTAFVAGVNSFAPAAPGGSGSYVRDLIAGLAGLAGLGTTQADATSLQSFGAAMSQLLQGAAGAIATESAGFGQIQADLKTEGSALADTLTGLTTQVSGAEEVDMAATATALSQVQTQLQASYRLIAGLRDLSLLNYL